MTISTLDPTTTLLVVDLQKGIAGLPTAHPMKDVVNNSVALLDAFRSRVLINVDARAPGRAERSFSTACMPAGWSEFLPELNRQASDHAVTKRRQAHELGFNVALAVDAMTDMDAEAHQNSVMRIFPKMSETATTQQLLDLLSQHPPSQALKERATS